MKIRTAHVSNSSTSSYLIVGYENADVDLEDYGKRIAKLLESAGISDDSKYWERQEVMHEDMYKTKVASKLTWDYAESFGAGVVVGEDDDAMQSVSLQKIEAVKEELVSKLEGVGIRVRNPENMHIFWCIQED